MRCLSDAVASNSARRVLAAAMLWDCDSVCAWAHWDLNPGPSAYEADVIPLHHVPLRNKPGYLQSSLAMAKCDVRDCTRGPLWGLNPRPYAYEAYALPAELKRRLG